MEKRTLGKTGLNIGIFTFGGIVVRDIPQNEADRIVANAVDREINYFDVAPSYGNSQEILGPALKAHRSKVYLACKTMKRTKAEAQSELEESFKLLKTDYFDVYQMHDVAPQDVDEVLGPGGAYEAIVEAKKKGYVRNIGFTSHSDEAAIKLINAAEFDTILFPINWACFLKNNLGHAAIKAAAAKNLGFIAIKGLAQQPKKSDDEYERTWYRPIFDDPHLADLALRFTLSQNIHTAVSPGDVLMLQLGLSIVEKYNGNPPPLNTTELEELTKRAKLVEKALFE